MSNMRPEGLSFPTRESRFVGDDVRAITSVLLSAAPPPPAFALPPQAMMINAMRASPKSLRVRMLHLVCFSASRGPRTTFKYDAALMRWTRFLFAVALLFPLPPAAAQQKVIVLGFDGVDARYTEKWMNEGKLPNLARLRQMGTFRPLRPTIPAQTPVSWSTFSTGIDPGRTGIFDFLRRDPKTYLPLFAAFDETKEPFFLGEKNAVIAAVAVLIVLSLLALIFRRAARVVILAIAV